MLVNGIGSSVVFCCSSVAGLILLSTAAPWKYRLPQGLWSQLTKLLQRPVDLSGGWDALVGPGPWKAGPGGRWPRMRPAPSMPCSRTPAPRPAAVVTTTQSFFRHPKRSLGVGPCRAAPPLLTLNSQSCRHRFESGEGFFCASALWAASSEAEGMWQVLATFL